MIYNFYTISDLNVAELTLDPFKYWLLLRDQEAFIDVCVEEVGGKGDSFATIKLEVTEAEGRFFQFCPAHSVAWALWLTLEKHSVDASWVMKTLMYGGHKTEYKIGWDELRLIDAQSVARMGQIIRSLPHDVIEQVIDVADLKSQIVPNPDFLSDRDQLVVLLREQLDDLKKALPTAEEAALGLTAEMN